MDGLLGKIEVRISEEHQNNMVKVKCTWYKEPYIHLEGIRALTDVVAEWLKRQNLCGQGWEGVDQALANIMDSVEEIEQVVDDWLWEGAEDVKVGA